MKNDANFGGELTNYEESWPELSEVSKICT